MPLASEGELSGGGRRRAYPCAKLCAHSGACAQSRRTPSLESTRSTNSMQEKPQVRWHSELARGPRTVPTRPGSSNLNASERDCGIYEADQREEKLRNGRGCLTKSLRASHYLVCHWLCQCSRNLRL